MIIFDDIEYKNFLSTGNIPVKINMSGSKASIITGTNGNGKSTFLDALIFCLFGKPFRKVRLAQLINNINNSDMLVTCNFRIGDFKYKVVRGIKPAVFEIYADGKLIPQPARTKDYQTILENDILNFNYKSFTQIVILGSASFVPFMQLPLASRREIIENILDIGIFSQMNEILKGTTIVLKEEIDQKRHKLDFIKNEYKLKLEFYNDKVKNRDQRIFDIEDKILEYEKDIQVIQEDRAILIEIRDEKEKKLVDGGSIRETITDLEKAIFKLKSDVKRWKKELNFYKKHAHCPKCDQKIDDEYKKTKTDSIKKDIEEAQNLIKLHNQSKESYENVLDDNEKVVFEYNKLYSDVEHLHVLESIKSELVENLKKELRTITDSDDDVDAIKIEIDQLVIDIKDLDVLLQKKIHIAHYYSIVHQILKDDGVKTRIINQYLPMINNTINKYLNMLDFSINFIFDGNFNESIYSQHMSDFTYHSFSEGEKSRIDLALLFTWREIALEKSRNATNLLIFDEILDGSLDNDGVENFMSIISADKNVSNVFVISHKDVAINSRFDQELCFKKRGHFSFVENNS